MNTLRVLQITDCHLFADRARTLLGINTNDSFKKVLTLVKQNAHVPDLILLTGDLAQDNKLQTYENLRDSLSAEFNVPIFYLPGNHDSLTDMDGAFQSAPFFSSKRQIVFPHWQIVLLNTQKIGATEGLLTDQEFAHLSQCLTQHPDLFTLIALHHPPCKIESAWMDSIDLENSANFLSIIKKHSKVKLILTGHIHQEFSKEIGSTTIFSTPATCIQFLPKSATFALDSAAPGYRFLELHADGTFDTKVYRLQNYTLQYQFNQSGY